MSRKIILIIFALMMTLGMGCRTALVHNVDKSPVTLYGEEKATLEQIEKAITTAGARWGWKMKTVSPGVMVGTLSVRSHLAVVDITYNTAEYSILYRDSSNLKYDGTNIHSNYNKWVKTLETSIKAEIARL